MVNENFVQNGLMNFLGSLNLVMEEMHLIANFAHFADDETNANPEPIYVG